MALCSLQYFTLFFLLLDCIVLINFTAFLCLHGVITTTTIAEKWYLADSGKTQKHKKKLLFF